ncbi:hypothetical protein PTKIN_Ptkin11bG0143300 [Pterospermum kingtungense]
MTARTIFHLPVSNTTVVPEDPIGSEPFQDDEIEQNPIEIEADDDLGRSNDASGSLMDIVDDDEVEDDFDSRTNFSNDDDDTLESPEDENDDSD